MNERGGEEGDIFAGSVDAYKLALAKLRQPEATADQLHAAREEVKATRQAMIDRDPVRAEAVLRGMDHAEEATEDFDLAPDEDKS